MPEGGTPLDITRGQEIGHFEFGGSTHMMLFQKGKVRLKKWAIEARKYRNGDPIHMGSVIATTLKR